MKLLALALSALSATMPMAALAYVGPGAGLSLLGALWALVAAIVVAIGFIVLWPVRKMMRRRRAQAQAQARNSTDGGQPAADDTASARAPQTEAAVDAKTP